MNDRMLISTWDGEGKKKSRHEEEEEEMDNVYSWESNLLLKEFVLQCLLPWVSASSSKHGSILLCRVGRKRGGGWGEEEGWGMGGV